MTSRPSRRYWWAACLSAGRPSRSSTSAIDGGTGSMLRDPKGRTRGVVEDFQRLDRHVAVGDGPDNLREDSDSPATADSGASR